MYFNVIMLLVPRVTKQMSLYYIIMTIKFISIYLSIYLYIHSPLHKYWNSKDKIALLAVDIYKTSDTEKSENSSHDLYQTSEHNETNAH